MTSVLVHSLVPKLPVSPSWRAATWSLYSTTVWV